jgi:hypothetical protein
MFMTRDATQALNEYLDRVNHALPLSPSRRTSVVDRLYHQIVTACEQQAHEAARAEIDVDLVRSQLASLGTPEQQADQLAADEQSWSAESLGFEAGRINEKASAFAKAAAERGEYVFRVSIETAAHALDVAAQKLREAADKLKTKT